jgi:hypothetical protein
MLPSSDFLKSLANLAPADREKALHDLELYIRWGPPEELLPRVAEDPKLFMDVFLPDMMKDPKSDNIFPPASYHEELFALARAAILKEEGFDEKLGLVVAAPRGGAKSTILSLCIILWAILCRHKTFVAIFSDTAAQAEYIGSNIRRELETNETIRLYFGDVCGQQFGRKWTQTDFEVVFVNEGGVIEHEGRVMVRGAGASVRGMRVGNRRPDLIIGDDMENDEDVRSLELRDKREAWWNRVVMPMVDPKNVSVIVGGTMLHDDALLARLIDSPQYITKKWSCWRDGIEGESYWPERFSKAYLLNIRDTDPITFALEYLNDPKLTGIRPIKPEDILFFTGSQVYRNIFGEWMFKPSPDSDEVPLDIFGGVDPAISEEDEACDFAAVMIGITRDERKDVLVLRCIMAKIDFPTQVSTMQLFARLFPEHRNFGFETAAYQRALPQQLKKQMKRDEVRILELPHIGGKLAKRLRIMKLAPLVAMRRLWFRACEGEEEGLPDYTKRVQVYGMQLPLYQQVATWPNGKLQDGADALAMAIETAGESGAGPLFGDVAAELRRMSVKEGSLTADKKVVYTSR